MFISTNAFAPAAAPKADLIGTVRQMMAVHKQRKALAQLDQTRLDDMGLSADDVATEIARPFWDI